MTNSNLKFKPVDKDRLFYDRFRYAVSFHLDEATCLRELDHGYIDTMIQRRIKYRDVSQLNWLNHKSILTRRWNDITDATVENLHSVADILINSATEFKLVTCSNTAWVYSNNRSLIKKIDQLEFLHDKSYTEARVSRPKNTIKLKNPRHCNRSYLKQVKLTAEQKNQLINFFLNQQDHIRISPGFTAYFSSSFHRTEDHYFIDHNGESWLLMLGLIRPGLIRKTVDLIADK